jgi:hypothetical protein
MGPIKPGKPYSGQQENKTTVKRQNYDTAAQNHIVKFNSYLSAEINQT